jgi:hypothetical protein
MFAVAGLAYLYLNKGEQGAESTKAATQVEAPEVNEPEVEAVQEPKPKPKRRSARRATSKKRTPAPAPKKTPSPASPTGEFEVTFVSMTAKATLLCGDERSDFVGRTRRKFSGVTTCRVDIGDAKGAVQVRSPGTMNCSVVGTSVRCVGP